MPLANAAKNKKRHCDEEKGVLCILVFLLAIDLRRLRFVVRSWEWERWEWEHLTHVHQLFSDKWGRVIAILLTRRHSFRKMSGRNL
jgi:hypothetical protein